MSPPSELKIIVTRDVFNPAWTLGVVELDLPGDGLGPLPFGFSVEDVDRHVELDPGRKVKGATAIPVGTYGIRLYDSPRHGPDTPELVGVPGFGHVQVHPGNTASDSEGCILMGLDRDVVQGSIGRSRSACRWLQAEVIEVIRAGGSVTIEIRRAEGGISHAH